MSNHVPSREPWHIKREIQLGHILTTLTISVVAVMYVGKIDQRIALVESAQGQLNATQRDRDERQDRQSNESVSLLRNDLREVNGKLDRLIERGRSTK